VPRTTSRPAAKRPVKPVKPKNCFLRGDTWWSELVIGGQRHRESLRTADAAEAAVRVAALRQRLERAALGVPGEESWQAAVVRWADEVLPGSVKPAVADRYLSSIRHFDAAFGQRLIASITTRDVADWVSARKKQGRLPRGKQAGAQVAPGSLGPVSNASIQRDLTALSRLLSACCSWGWRPDNPCQAFDRTTVRERREPKRPPSREEIDIAISAASPGVAGVLRILAETGMRMEEGVQLERSQVDGERRQVLLTRTKTSRPRTIAWATPGGDATAALEAGAAKGLLYTSGTTGEAFSNFSSNHAQLLRRIARDEAAAGRAFRRFGVHDLRHAFAIRWLKAGGSLYRLSRHLGHSSVKVTEQNYLGYLTVEEQERVQAEADRLAAE
jgi:integrase/recombinase XerD